MTKEHLGLALALQVPVFVVVTKIDMCPANVLEDTLRLLQRILKSPGCRKMPVLVQNKDDVVCSATNFSSERYLFQICLLGNFACFFVVYCFFQINFFGRIISGTFNNIVTVYTLVNVYVDLVVFTRIAVTS